MVEFIGPLLCQRQKHLDSLHHGLAHLLTGTFVNAVGGQVLLTPVAGSGASSGLRPCPGRDERDSSMAAGAWLGAWRVSPGQQSLPTLSLIISTDRYIIFIHECFYL